MSTLLIRILERNNTSSGDVRAALENVNFPLQWVLIRNDQSLEQGEATASTLRTVEKLVEKESNLDSSLPSYRASKC